MIDDELFAASGPSVAGLAKRVTVAATPCAVFEAWTTTSGLNAFLNVDAVVDLRVGGRYELYFAPADEVPPGQRGSEGCQILAYLPDQLLCFSWNAPPQFADERARRTWVTVRLVSAGSNQTEVLLDHVGFGQGGQWDQVHAYFDRAWTMVLDALVAHFD